MNIVRKRHDIENKLTILTAAAVVAGTTATDRVKTAPFPPIPGGRSRSRAALVGNAAATEDPAAAAAVDHRVAVSGPAHEARRLTGRKCSRATRSWSWSCSGWGMDPAASTLNAMRISLWRLLEGTSLKVFLLTSV